jgi:hypothetical protein
MEYRYRPDGTVDIDFYRIQGAALRREAMQRTGDGLRRSGRSAAASIVARCGTAIGAMLNRMFPEETPRLWSRRS